MAGAVGIDRCAAGYIYSVAAKHEATTIGQIVRVGHGKGGPYYHYEFSANGPKVDDYSDVCSTALTPDACWNNGQVLVYYSYEPFSNSRLEDFKVASTHAYKIGVPVLLVALSLFVLGSVVFRLSRKNKREDDDSDSGDEAGEDDSEEVQEAIHVTPTSD